MTSGTVLSLIIQSPTIQLYSYLSIFLHNFFLSYVWQGSLCLALWRPLTECCLLPAVRWNWSRLWECIRPFIKNLMAFPQKQASSLAQENRKRVLAKEIIVIKWIKDDSQYRQGLIYWYAVNRWESSLLQTSTKKCKNKKKKREPVKDVFLRCYHCGHLSSTQGVLLGSPRDRREQVSRSSPWESRVRGLVEVCILRHSGLSPLCDESLTKDQRSHPAKSCRHGQPTVRPGVGRGGCWEGHRKHLLWCFSMLQSQVGGKGCSLASPGLSVATPTFGKNSWLNQPNYSHSRNNIMSSTVLSSKNCLMLLCPQEVWIPQYNTLALVSPSLWHLATLHLVLWDIVYPDRNPRNSLEQSHMHSDFIKPFYGPQT